MSVVALVAGKGSPGVTTAAMVLSGVWPRHCLLAECDPAGGDLVFRLLGEAGRRLAPDRGIVSLATASRSGVTPDLAWQHAQVSDGGLPVLAGPASESQAAALAPSWPTIAAAFAVAVDGDVVVDCGRLSTSTPLPLLTEANLVLLVCRATPESVAHARNAVERLRQERIVPCVLVIGAGDDAVQVRDALRPHGELDVLGPLANDPAGAAGVAGQWTRRLDRTALVGSARLVARALDARLAERGRAPSQVTVPGGELGVVNRVG